MDNQTSPLDVAKSLAFGSEFITSNTRFALSGWEDGIDDDYYGSLLVASVIYDLESIRYTILKIPVLESILLSEGLSPSAFADELMVHSMSSDRPTGRYKNMPSESAFAKMAEQLREYLWEIGFDVCVEISTCFESDCFGDSFTDSVFMKPEFWVEVREMVKSEANEEKKLQTCIALAYAMNKTLSNEFATNAMKELLTMAKSQVVASPESETLNDEGDGVKSKTPEEIKQQLALQEQAKALKVAAYRAIANALDGQLGQLARYLAAQTESTISFRDLADAADPVGLVLVFDKSQGKTPSNGTIAKRLRDLKRETESLGIYWAGSEATKVAKRVIH